jgi:transcriptional antiterminator Rof (Rho-off)
MVCPNPGKIACRQLLVEMQTRELQESWLIWLDASDQLTRCLHELTVAITLRDAERINRLRPEADQLRRRLVHLDEDIVVETSQIARKLKVDSCVSRIAANLEKTEGQAVQALSNRKIVAERTIQYLLDKNNELFRCRFAVVHAEEAVARAKAA